MPNKQISAPSFVPSLQLPKKKSKSNFRGSFVSSSSSPASKFRVTLINLGAKPPSKLKSKQPRRSPALGHPLPSKKKYTPSIETRRARNPDSRTNPQPESKTSIPTKNGARFFFLLASFSCFCLTLCFFFFSSRFLSRARHRPTNSNGIAITTGLRLLWGDLKKLEQKGKQKKTCERKRRRANAKRNCQKIWLILAVQQCC